MRTKKSYLPFNDRDERRPLSFLTPYPQQMRLGEDRIDLLNRRVVCQSEKDTAAAAEDLITGLRQSANVKVAAKPLDADYVIRLRIAEQGLKPEGYTLEIDEAGANIIGQDDAGLWYGVQTLLQLAAFGQGTIPALKIRDWPALSIRSVMLDMGRSIYTKPIILRAIRIMSRLKLNMLHLHLYDDQLMSVKFKHLPLGSENPHALTLKDLAEIVHYARQYHISVCPEMDSWAHTGSIIYHYPECYGGPGMWGGKCFAIGPKAFNILEKIYDEVVPTLETQSMVHVGIDEAIWKLAPEWKAKPGLNPEWLVDRLYDILMKVGRRHHKKLTMRLWADHGGRPIPQRIQNKVIVEPWNYFESAHEDIKRKVRRFAGKGKTPFMMGAGSSSMHFNGTFGSTRLWCQAGYKAPNCRGVTICMWEGNMVDRYLLSIYQGAACAWNARQIDAPSGEDIYGEYVTGRVIWRMLSWQTLFQDANMDAILRDRGPAVYRGYYLSGPKTGQPVAPTVLVTNAMGQ